VRFRPSGIHAHDGGRADGRPHGGRRGLQIQRGLIFRQNNRLGCILRGVDQFFSIWSVKSSTAWARRERKTRAGR
jgi:hypothetical protein